ERLQALERAPDPTARAEMWLVVGDVVAIEDDAARRRRLQTRDDVEQRGLARAVRTDQAGDDSLVDADRHAVQRLQPAEAHGDVLGLEQRHAATPAPRPWAPTRLALP